jgi:hypothetical protein
VAAGLALGQGIAALTSPTGTELITVQPVQPNGQPAATQATITLNNARATASYVTTTVTGNVTIPPLVSRYIITAQPSAATISLPASPVPDGDMVEIVNGTASAFATNTVTLAPNTGQTLVGGSITLTTLGAGASVELQYSLANNTWYRLR